MTSSRLRALLLSLSCGVLGLVACSSDSKSKSGDGSRSPSSGTLYNLVITQNVRVHSEKLGTLDDISYRAELAPDPDNPSGYLGMGTYDGMITYTAANCLNSPEIYKTQDVSGDLEASATILGVPDWMPAGDQDGEQDDGIGVATLPGEKQEESVSFTLATRDWRWAPVMLDPAIYGDVATEFYSGDELEGLRGAGSTSSDLFKGMKFEGDTATNTRTTTDDSDPDCKGRVTRTITDKVVRVAIADKLEAKPKAEVVNWAGDGVKLSGSLSTPAHRITSYQWTLTPSSAPEACPPGVPPKTYTDKSVEVKILCPMTAQLTVTDKSGNSDTKTIDVPFEHRPWKTAIDKTTPPKAYGDVQLYNPNYVDKTFLGRNICTDDDITSHTTPNHWIHRELVPEEFNPKPGTKIELTWEDTGYTIAQIDDEKGPFHEWWYIREHKLHIKRKALIQAELMDKKSATVLFNQDNCPAGEFCDIDLLIDQVKEHETAHTDLVVEALAQKKVDDPAPLIEKLYVAPDPDGHAKLKELADRTINLQETKLADASSEASVATRLKERYPKFDTHGYVYLKDKSNTFRRWYVPNFAELGLNDTN
jgi:hypothetical protein